MFDRIFHYLLQLTHKWKGTCVSEYTGHIEGNPDFTAFLLYGVTLCFPENRVLYFSCVEEIKMAYVCETSLLF